MRIKEPGRSIHEISGTILHQDKFGNLMTNIPLSLFQSLKPSRTRPRTVLHLARTKIERSVTSYAEVKDSRPFFLVNSQGLIEIAVRQASAAAAPGAKPGDPVRIRLEP